MPKPWSSGPNESSVSPGSHGLNLIRRYADGESLTPSEMVSMRAAMYLITQYVYPPRTWDDFRWEGPEHFIREIWPEVRDRSDIFHGFFGDGGKSP